MFLLGSQDQLGTWIPKDEVMDIVGADVQFDEAKVLNDYEERQETRLVRKLITQN